MNNPTAEQLAAALEARRNGRGFMARCPAHDDRTPSLAIDEGKNGQAVLHCHAGCSQGEVISALQDRGLWHTPAALTLTPKKPQTWQTVPASTTPPSIQHPKHGKPNAVWPYHNEGGKLLGYACRFDNPGGKIVLPFTHGINTASGETSWQWKAFSEPRPLYGLDKLKSGAEILIVEGEKAADAAQKLLPDQVVMTWPGGSKATSKADFSPLAGFKVMVWPDADEPGHKAAKDVCEGLTRAKAGAIVTINPPDDKPEGWDLADAEAEGWTGATVAQWVAEGNAEPVTPPAPRFKLLHGSDLEALPPIEWTVKGVLPSRGLAQTFGPSKAGKSFFVFDMACHIAEGRDWFGYRVKQRPVVYLALEGEAGFKLRAEAWKIANGRDSLPRDFFMVMQPFRINQPQDVADLAAVSPKGAVVVIDTQACAAPDSEENAGKDMGQLIDGAKTLAAYIEGLTMLVAHTGKDATKGARGHSSQLPALDASIEVKRRGQQRLWRADKVKEGLDGTEHPFSLEVVNLGIDDDGDPITSCAIKVDSRDSLKRAKVMTESQRQGVAAFWCAAEKAPTLDEDGSFLGVHLEDWRPVFYEISTADNAKAKKVAFQRLRKALVTDGMLTAKNDIYRMTTPDAGLRARQIEKDFAGTGEHFPPAEHQADNGAEKDQGNIDFMTGEILETPVNTGLNDEEEHGTQAEH